MKHAFYKKENQKMAKLQFIEKKVKFVRTFSIELISKKGIPKARN